MLPNNKRTGYIRLVVLLCILLLPAEALMAGPVFAPGTKLSVIHTDHFDIIYSDASRPSALHLYSIAESVYSEVSAKLGIAEYGPIPLVITPDVGSFNGYTAYLPYPHIVLYDTPSNPDWAVFDDNFRGLFIHELTHALSMRSRAPWLQFLGGFFGSWILPAVINAPQYMSEGTAVNFESANGLTGRASDPLTLERLRQDIYENRFKSPADASGLYGDFPSGRICYEYGGLFNSYINKKYGAAAYAELWKAMGNLWPLGFSGVFKKTYGISLEKAWADFRYSLELPGIADAPAELLPSGSEYANLRGSLVAGPSAVFWVDSSKSRAFALDTAGVQAKTAFPRNASAYPLFDADTTTAISDASPDADPAAAQGRLLVSRAAAAPDGRDRLETAIYDLAARRFIPGAVFKDIREARFSGSGIVAIAADLHNTDLVYIEGGKRRVILKGRENLMFASPCVLGASKIALIVVIDGERHLGVCNTDTGALSLIEGPEPGLFRYIRGLSACGSRLYFSIGGPGQFYRLGCVENGGILIDSHDYSGGVFYPVEASGSIFYAGAFSQGLRICLHPLRPADFSAGAAAGEDRARADVAAPEGTLWQAALHEAAFDGAAGAQAAISDAPAGKPYSPLRFASPFNSWLFYLNPAESLAGLPVLRAAFFFADPFDTDTAAMELSAYPAFPLYMGAALTLTDKSLPLQFSAILSDSLGSIADGQSAVICRKSAASLEADLSIPLYPEPRSWVFGAGASGLALAGYADGSSSPYEWSYSAFGLVCSALAGFQGRLPGRRNSSRGADFIAYGDYDINTSTYRSENRLTLASDSPWFRFDLWGAWANGQILKIESADLVFADRRRPALYEFSSLMQDSYNGILQCSAQTRAVDAAVNKDILGLYLRHIDLDLGTRAAAVLETDASAWDAGASVFARASVQLAAALGGLIGSGTFYADAFLCLGDLSGPALRAGCTLGLSVSSSGRQNDGRESSLWLYH